MSIADHMAVNAIGMRDGDTLTVENQWARITIMRDDADNQYVLSGDTDSARPRWYYHAADALAAALVRLAEFERGRA